MVLGRLLLFFLFFLLFLILLLYNSTELLVFWCCICISLLLHLLLNLLLSLINLLLWLLLLLYLTSLLKLFHLNLLNLATEILYALKYLRPEAINLAVLFFEASFYSLETIFSRTLGRLLEPSLINPLLLSEGEFTQHLDILLLLVFLGVHVIDHLALQR